MNSVKELIEKLQQLIEKDPVVASQKVYVVDYDGDFMNFVIELGTCEEMNDCIVLDTR